jgi:N-acetyl-gamma-glutamylphosphate reductase
MKVLIVGASGMIGREALIQCLAHPDITRVVAFARKSLPEDVSGHSKLETVIITDFSSWSEDILQKQSDAVGIIW